MNADKRTQRSKHVFFHYHILGLTILFFQYDVHNPIIWAPKLPAPKIDKTMFVIDTAVTVTLVADTGT